MSQPTNHLEDAPIRIVLADDNPHLLGALRAQICQEPDMVVVGEAATGREAIDAVASDRVDVVILDARMPVLDGIRAIPGLRAVSPQTRIIMYSSDADRRPEALAMGAHAWCDKSTPGPALSEQIRRLATAPTVRTYEGEHPDAQGTTAQDE